MRDIKRIKRLLNKIEQIWNKNPDFRFGQLLINLGIVDDSIRVWNNPDNGIEQHLDRILKEPKVKQSYLKKLEKIRKGKFSEIMTKPFDANCETCIKKTK